MRRDRFERGSGCFTCEMCGRLTRAAGDNAGLGMCPLCYELAGIENYIFDNSPEDERFAAEVKEANKLYKAIVKKGGKPQFAHMQYIK